MRILYSLDTQLPGTGADTEQVVNTVAALARAGVAIELLAAGDVTGPGDAAALRQYYHVAGEFPLHLLGQRYRGLRGPEKWSHARRVPRHPAAGGVDLIYTRNLPTAWCVLRAGRRVVYEHFRPWGDQYPPLQPLLRNILRHPNLTAAVFHSRHALESYRRLGVPESRMLVAHNGWDPARMSPRLTQVEARSRLGLETARFTVGYSGRMNARKGLDVVLAMARATPDIAFLLIGSEAEGPVETEARALANVRIVPWQSHRDLAPWLYAADVLLIPPSLAPLERHGNTVLPIKLFLYLAAGRVLLAPHAPDTAELLLQDQNARLVPPGDVPGAVAALRALAADPVAVARLSAGALATATDLTWDSRAQRIHSFLRQRMAAKLDTSSPDPWRRATWLGETAKWFLPFR